MDEITIREALPEDLESLLQFEQGVIKAERPFDPTLDEDPINYYDMEKMIFSPDTLLLVATCKEQLVGSGYARIEKAKPYNKHESYSYLGFMYVLPDFRGRGINQRIIKELKKWSLSKGLHEMRLDVYDKNDPAVKAYEKAGFTGQMLTMRLDLRTN